VLAPLLIMGGALGAFESRFIPVGDAGLWAIVSMAAMMGGTMRSPLTAMVFTLELTHDLNLLPALLVGSIAAHALTVLLLRRSILTEKVARRGYHVTREYSVDPLTALRVEEVMDRDVPTVPASMKVSEFAERIARHDPRLTRRQGVPVLDDEQQLVGIITRGDVLRALERGLDGGATVLDAGSRRLVVAYPDEVLHEAVVKMLRHDIGRLPVVSREEPRRLVGYLGRAGVMAARVRQHEEEYVREQGLFPKPA
jgi:CBS domain-containing protein